MGLRHERHAAQRTRRVCSLVAVLALACGCAKTGRAGPILRRAPEPPVRTSGCIDTPFIGGDVHSTTSGVSCGRERSGVSQLRGRVVAEELGGLAGAGLEGVWVTLHPQEAGPLQLDALPPARAEQQTGPRGSFSIVLSGAQAYVIAVRLEPDSPPLAARRVEAQAENANELVLTVPLDDALRARLGLDR